MFTDIPPYGPLPAAALIKSMEALLFFMHFPDWAGPGPQEGRHTRGTMTSTYPQRTEHRPQERPLAPGMERRATVRLRILWDRLRRGRPLPSMNDLNPDQLPVKWTACFIVALHDGAPGEFDFVGGDLTEQCSTDLAGRSVADVPAQTVLARALTARDTVLATAEPEIVEGEVTLEMGGTALFRTILMPFGSDRQTVDTLVGAATYKIVEN